VTIDVDEPATRPIDPPPDPSGAALAGYLSRMRRQRRIYLVVLAVLVVITVTVVEVVLRTGEIANATLHQAKSAAPAPPNVGPSSTLTQAWHSDDATALGVPFDAGTVVTYDKHTVSGRNYATGVATWTYTRSDLPICTVYQEAGITMAIYQDHDGFCDEIDAFDTSTGARDFYRTLDSNGNTITTTNPATFSASPYSLIIATPKYIQAVNPNGAIDRWTFIEPAGCTGRAAVLGSSGVLISQHCSDGNHLLLRDPTAGDDDNDKAKSIWRIASSAIPVSADQLVSALDPATGKLTVYNTETGKITQTQALDPAPVLSPIPAITATAGNSGEVVHLGATTYTLQIATGTQLWSVGDLGQPTVQDPDPLVIGPQGVTKLDGATGAISTTYSIATPPAGATAVRLGTDFVIAGSSTTVYR
jgi:PQQ-like domain